MATGSMTENAAKDRLRKGIGSIHFQRVELPSGTGVFDVNYCGVGREGWIEHKACCWPVRDNTLIKPGLRPSQMAWGIRRVQAGGRMFLFTTLDDGFSLIRLRHLDLPLLAEGVTLGQLLDMSVTYGSPGDPWNFKQIKRALLLK